MMIGPYPRSPDRIDGGVAAAMTYLSQALIAQRAVDLVGVRVARDGQSSELDGRFDWPIRDLSHGSLGLSSLFRRQRLELQQLLRAYRPDIVHGQGVDVAGFLAVGCGVPAVVTVHGILGEDAKYKTNMSSRIRAAATGLLVERHSVRKASDLISISPYVTEYYGRQIAGRVHEIPNAVSPDYFAVRRAAERGRFLYAGRIIKRKGILDLVRAVGRDSSAVTRLVLAGGCPDRNYQDQVRREIARYGLEDRVSFAGLLDEEAVLHEFSRAEALVLPSYQETAPMVIQQAMASGVPVLASRICGVPYQIEHGVTGMLFEAGDVGQLSDLIGRFAVDPALAGRLGRAAKEVATARFHAQHVAEATRKTYESMLGSERV